MTVDPPKLVDKRATTPHTEHHADPLAREEIACAGDTVVVASAPSVSAGPLEVPVGPGGWLAPADEQRLYTYAFSNARTEVSPRTSWDGSMVAGTSTTPSGNASA